jgi:L-cysteine/cystine lyase
MRDVLSDRETVRAALPALRDGAYLNTGGAGPLAGPAAAALAEAAERSLAHGRKTLAAVLGGDVAMAALRSDLARLLGSGPERIAVTVNTTHGVNCVAWGIDWRPGDVAITTALEHPGLAAPLHLLGRRLGVRVEVISAEEASGDLAGAVARLAGPRTRLVALSHVAYGTGEVLDVAGAAAAARRAGALTLVDGAQTVGAIPVRPDELGVDAVAFPAHKWLLGPEGLGGLWLSEEALARVEVTFAGYESGTDHLPGGSFTPFPGARRLELSTPPLDLVAAWRAALAWLDEVGWDAVYEGTARAAARAREVLQAVEGVSVVTPPRAAGLVAFTLAGADPPPVCRALAARDIAIRWIDVPPLLRLSAGFFTDEGDLRLLAEGLSDPVVARARAGADG